MSHRTIPADVAASNSSDSARRERRQGWIARAASPLCAWGPRTPNAFGILMYHRVAPLVRGVSTPTWNVTPGSLRRQLTGLLDLGYEAWPLRRVLEHRTRGLPIPPRVFVVTFDDGHETVRTQALPILREMGVPATVFLATSFLDSGEPYPFDDWSAAGNGDVDPSNWRSMTALQCCELLDSGLVELGAHTHSHEDFRGRTTALRDDLELCLAVLKDRFGVERPTFAFPYGAPQAGFASAEMISATREAGCVCALTTESVRARGDTSPFGWGRFTAYDSDTPRTLAAKLDGWFEWGCERLRQGRDLLRGRRLSANVTSVPTRRATELAEVGR